MANRILRESINESKGLSECSPFSQDLYKRLILYADDHGRITVDIEIIWAKCFPRELVGVSKNDIVSGLFELVGEDKIRIYTCTEKPGQIFAHFPRWDKHQRVRNKKSKFPDPESYNLNDWFMQKYLNRHQRLEVYKKNDFKCSVCKSEFKLKNCHPLRSIRLLSDVLKINYFSSGKLICASCLFDLDLRMSTEFLLEIYQKELDGHHLTGNLFEDEEQETTNIEVDKKKDKKEDKDKEKLVIPYNIIKDEYHKICKGLTKIRDITEERKKKIRVIWKDSLKKKEIPIDTFIDAFEKISASPWHNGKNNRNWIANLDFIINNKNWNNILELPRPEARKPDDGIPEETRKYIEECYKKSRGQCGALRYGVTKDKTCQICIKLMKEKGQNGNKKNTTTR